MGLIMQKTIEQLEWLPVSKLYQHPRNPRLFIRQKQVDSIATYLLESGFRPSHALLVRPHEDGYQILSGNHRKLAAEKAGLETVPCWVLDLNDDEAMKCMIQELVMVSPYTKKEKENYQRILKGAK